MSEYYYYKENGNLYRFHIERDDEPWNPRKDQDGNIGTMNLYWNRYMLGDNEGKGDADDALNEIIFENVSDYKYDEEKVIYEMGRGEKMILIQLQENIVLLPCYIYEHGGLSISCSDSGYPFNDRWDAGCAGYIYTTKEKCFEQWGVKEMSDFDWKTRAARELVDEVKLYDKYLQGECYGYCQEKYEPQDDEWIDDESCWGFYSDKWGDDLARDIANDGITGEPFISEVDAKAEMEELRIMAQADTVVCV